MVEEALPQMVESKLKRYGILDSEGTVRRGETGPQGPIGHTGPQGQTGSSENLSKEIIESVIIRALNEYQILSEEGDGVGALLENHVFNMLRDYGFIDDKALRPAVKRSQTA